MSPVAEASPASNPLRSQTKLPTAVWVAVVLGLIFNIGFGVLNRTGWGVDFNQFYSAGQLTGSGHLYDWDLLRKAEAVRGVEVPTGRLPVVLYGHKILGTLPYRAAQLIWLALCASALVGFAWMWPGAERPTISIALAWSLPAALTLLFGQDTPFWLAFFAAGLLLMERKKPWLAGIAFSLCICKFHLALGIPVMLIAWKRWNTLAAGAVSFAALTAVCFPIEGPQWPLRYLKMSQMAAFSPPVYVMPTLSGITSRLPWPETAQAAASIAIVLLLALICRRVTDAGVAGSAAAACGLLVAPHALFADTVLLLPLAVLTVQRQDAPSWLKGWAVLMLSPFPFLLASIYHLPLLWQLTIAPFVVAALLEPSADPRLQSIRLQARRLVV